jgi:hypothetical protein
MTSERQIEANRQNAKRSTGPKTATGKARSRRNAFRHGLSRPIASEDMDLEALARPIVTGVEHEALPFADIARAKQELRRIRAVRYGLLAALLQSPDMKWANRLRGLERYERAAFAVQRRGIRRRKE